MGSIDKIVDDRFGGRIGPFDRNRHLDRGVEVPGSRPLAFEAEAGPAVALRAWPAEHVANVVFYEG
jgi:5-dehydro-2-deoxygluconokinase